MSEQGHPRHLESPHLDAGDAAPVDGRRAPDDSTGKIAQGLALPPTGIVSEKGEEACASSPWADAWGWREADAANRSDAAEWSDAEEWSDAAEWSDAGPFGATGAPDPFSLDWPA
jgi:hypothetical protein